MDVLVRQLLQPLLCTPLVVVADVAVRNVRRDVMHDLKELSRDGDVGDDDERRAEERLQKLTDEHVHRIDDLLKKKEEEIMEV